MENETELIDYKPLEFYLRYVGSLWLTDSISLFVMPFVIILGLFLSILGFIVIITNQEFKLNLYFYLKVTFFNSAVANAIGILFAFVNARRYLPFSNSWTAMWYSMKIVSPCIYTCFFYNNMLEIVMTFDKLCIFVKKFSVINKKILGRPKITSLIILCYCVTTNSPAFIQFEPRSRIVDLSENETYHLIDYRITDFGESDLGIVFTYIIFFLMDILPFFMLLSLNIPLVILLKIHLNKKEELTFSKNKSKITPHSLTRTQTGTGTQTEDSTGLKKPVDKTVKKREITASIMVLTISFISLIKTILIILSILFTYIEIGLLSVLSYTYSFYFIFLASSINFFIVYFFDSKFKTAIKKIKNRLLSKIFG